MLAGMRALALTLGILTSAALAAIPPRAPRSKPQAASQSGHPAGHAGPSHPANQPAGNSGADPSKAHSQNGHIPQDRAADSYAIYSLLMPGRLFQDNSNDSGKRWALAEKTVTFDEMNPRIDPRGALKPPSGNEKAFHQAVHNFEISRDVSYTLQRRLRLDHPYSLLSPAQVRDLRHAKAGLDPGSRTRAHYAAYPGVTFFSAVYFSDDQKAALVYVNDWCGVLCSQGQWVYLEKANGHWERKSGITVPGA